MIEQNQHLDALQDIRRMMKRSSKFISLSGLSGIAAGVWALAGAYFAEDLISKYYATYSNVGYTGTNFQKLEHSLLLLAGIVLGAALMSAFFFTWRRANQNKMPLWDHTSKTLAVSMMVPLITGGLFILAMLRYDEWRFVGPLSLIFYGLALVSAGKYTLNDIRYLGISEIILGLINTQYIGHSLYFWAAGFGILHILYGFAMWWKYERTNAAIEVSNK
jgi:hypothetical protein